MRNMAKKNNPGENAQVVTSMTPRTASALAGAEPVSGPCAAVEMTAEVDAAGEVAEVDAAGAVAVDAGVADTLETELTNLHKLVTLDAETVRQLSKDITVKLRNLEVAQKSLLKKVSTYHKRALSALGKNGRNRAKAARARKE